MAAELCSRCIEVQTLLKKYNHPLLAFSKFSGNKDKTAGIESKQSRRLSLRGLSTLISERFNPLGFRCELCHFSNFILVNKLRSICNGQRR